MKNTRRMGKLMAVLLCCALMTGCWSATEMKQLAIVMGIGVDVGSAPDSYLLTAQIARPSHFKTSNEQGAAGGKPYLNAQMEGTSVNMAMHEMTRQMSRKLYTAHNQVLVLGEDVARTDIAPVLNFFIRSVEGKFAVRFLIAQGKAGELLGEDAGLEQLPAMHLKSLLHNEIQNVSVEETTLHSFLSDMVNSGIAATAPLVSLYTDESGANRARVRGLAVFSGGRQVGELSTEQARVKQLVQGTMQDGYIQLDAFGSYVSLDLVASETSVRPRVEDGRVIAAIHIRQEYMLVDTGTEAEFTTKDTLAEIGQIAATNIIASIEDLVRHTQALGADVCGFGEMARRKYPKQMKPLLENWPENYKNLGMEMDVEAHVTNTGAILMPMSPGGGWQ